MDIQSRVVNYYKNNSFIQKYLKGIDPKTSEVVLSFNNENRRVGIDSLESIKSEEELNNFLQGKIVASEISVAAPAVSSEPSIVETPASATEAYTPNLDAATINPVSNEQSTLVSEPSKETLDDIKILVELKNKEGLDNLLKKFAINPTTGLIDVNSAISKITRNTMNEVEKAIKNNYEFSVDATKYDIEGNFIGNPMAGLTPEDEKIVKSFNNIKIYLDASKMYPEQVNYSDEQVNNFMKTYISKVKEELHGSEDSSNNNSNQEAAPVQEVIESTSDRASSNATASAGFADIFVLTVIVLVYAVIIVNLILKLK